LSLRAIGRSVDRLHVQFEIWSAGTLAYVRGWDSQVYFHYPAETPDGNWTPTARLAKVRAEFATFFRDSAFVPTSQVHRRVGEAEIRDAIRFFLGYTAVRDSLAERGASYDSLESVARRAGWAYRDTAHVSEVWAAIRRADPVSFRLFMGGENTEVIAWDPVRRIFRVIYACC
jgi:hypothetical protein